MSHGISSNGQTERSEVFSNAMKFISSMEASPSCQKLAIATLLRSCRSIHPGNDQTRKSSTVERLDRVKSIFAARLAICELVDANAIIPQQCDSLHVPGPPGKNSIFKHFTTISKYHREHEVSNENEDESILDIGSCLGALESRPQWWTSYSNARQNAIAICEATRSEVEKGNSKFTH